MFALASGFSVGERSRQPGRRPKGWKAADRPRFGEVGDPAKPADTWMRPKVRGYELRRLLVDRRGGQIGIGA